LESLGFTEIWQLFYTTIGQGIYLKIILKRINYKLRRKKIGILRGLYNFVAKSESHFSTTAHSRVNNFLLCSSSGKNIQEQLKQTAK